jgi:hypothetical protein
MRGNSIEWQEFETEIRVFSVVVFRLGFFFFVLGAVLLATGHVLASQLELIQILGE